MINENKSGAKINSYEEDSFDLEKIKNEAFRHAREVQSEHIVRRKVSVYKFFIVILAFVVMLLLYNFINQFIQYLDYMRYSGIDLFFTA